MIFDSFKAYISEDEQEVLNKCLDGQIDAIDDDVLEILSLDECYRLPTHENVNVILEELVHQELIQKPKYIAMAWSDELQALKCFPEFCDASSLCTMYEEKILCPNLSLNFCMLSQVVKQNECALTI